MPEGTKIERIEDLKPGDVLVLPSSEASKLPLTVRCVAVDQEMILYTNEMGNLAIPCACTPAAGGLSVKLLDQDGLLEFFRLKSRSGGEVDLSLPLRAVDGAEFIVTAAGEKYWPHMALGDVLTARPLSKFDVLAGADGKCVVFKPGECVNAVKAGLLTSALKAPPFRVSDDGAPNARKGWGAPPRMVSSDVDLEAYKVAINSRSATFIDTQTETDWDATDGLGEGSPFAIGYTRLPIEDIADGATIYISGGWLNIRTLDGRVITSKQPIMLMPSPDPKPTVPDDVQVGPVDFLALNKEFSSK